MSASTSNNGFVYYHYDPSLAAAIVFASLFGTSTILHLYQVLRTRTWFLIPFIVGSLCETIGYCGRAVSATQSPNWTLSPYIIQSLLLLVAPALFSASIYMLLGKIILMIDGASYSLIRPKKLTFLFVSSDVFCFLIQGSGAGILAKGGKQSTKVGEWVVVGGLILQILSFGAFVIVAFVFHRRVLKTPTKRATDPSVNWQKPQFTLYVASILILVRNIVRVVEFSQGYDGWLLEHEWTLFVFDACLMLGVTLLYNVLHPSEVKATIQGGRYATVGGLSIQHRVKLGDIEQVNDKQKALPQDNHLYSARTKRR